MVQDESNGQLRSPTSIKYTQPAGQKPLDGLEVLQGHMCPVLNLGGTICSRAFQATSSFVCCLSTHFDNPLLDPTLHVSPIQTLFSQGGLQMYFAVNMSLSQQDPPPNSAYTNALKFH